MIKSLEKDGRLLELGDSTKHLAHENSSGRILGEEISGGGRHQGNAVRLQDIVAG